MQLVMRVGLHISVSGGLIKTALHARSLKCECLQIFARNARGWRARTYREEEIAGFKEILSSRGIAPVVIHSCYLVNLASPNRELRERSFKSIADDMARAHLLGGRFVVFHFGHHMGEGREHALRILAREIRILLKNAPLSVDLLLENSAGRGSELGGDWQDFVQLFDLLAGEPRVGVCFDTCHAHAAGYHLDTAKHVGKTLRDFKAALGFDRLRLLHLNDCRAPAGSHIDHHQHIGRGTIGDEGFRTLLRRRELRMRTPQFSACASQTKDSAITQELSGILETPFARAGDDRRNLRHVWSLRSHEEIK